MCVVITESEHVSPVSPSRLYKAMVFEAANVWPRAIPDFIKSVELIEGDGGPGSIKKLNLAQGYVKHKVDVVDEEKYVYHYSVIEGIALVEPLEKVSYEYKLVAKSDGGSIIKSIGKYYTKGDAQLTQEFLKANKERSSGFIKAVKAYLLANPDFN